uniref:Dienelactone hydrolase n=1 Tax=Glaciozyma antarctica TaxID=105987 RepID=A0A221SE81_9BASI|nr:dienelactone hydrolase [Glaciozyma antarctica]
MSAPTLGSCCIRGVSHEGTPKGTVTSFNGTPTYVTLPSGDYDKTKALLFCPDVFGLELQNAKLLADDFAANGYATYLPDYLAGDALHKDALNDGTFDLMGWLGKHPQSVTRPYLDALIAGLKEQGVKEFAATGYCYGGRYVFDLALDHIIKVAIVSHPSLLSVPEDLEKLKSVGTIPFLWNTCETDFAFGPEKQEIADKVFADDKNYKRTFAPGCDHGFAVRGDLSVPAIKAGKEVAFEESVKWLQKHF